MIPGPVLPSLVKQARGVRAFVLDEAITVRIPVTSHPFVGRTKGAPQLACKTHVLGFLQVGRPNDQEERCAVDAPIVWELPMWQLRTRRGVEPMFMQNFPGLLLRNRVHDTAL